MSDERTSVEGILAGATCLAGRMEVARTWLDINLRNDPGLSRELIHLLLPEAVNAGDLTGATWLRFFQGWLALDADDYEQGLATMEDVRASFEALGHREGLARCLNALGAAHLSMGVLDLALDLFRESAAQAEQAGRLEFAGAAAMNMAECLYDLDDPREALQVIEHCRKHYAIAPHNITVAHGQAGSIYRSLGRLEEAERELLEAVRTAGSAQHDSLDVRQILAETYLDAGRLDDAEALIAKGLEDCTHSNERLIGTRFRLARARLSVLRGRTGEALPDLEAAIAAARDIGARKVEADAERSLYLAWQACGEWERALAAFIRHAKLKDAMRGEQTMRRVLGLHEERARREARHFETLYHQISSISEIGQRITSSLNLDTALETLYGAINGLMDAPTIFIALVDEERACLDYRLAIVRGQRLEPFSRSLAEETFGCWCVNHRSDVLIGDLESEYQRYVRSFEDLLFDGVAEKSLVFVPLMLGEKVVGTLSVQSHLPHAYDKRKVETIRAIGAYIAIAIENSKLFLQIQRLATLDELTGLLNRRRLTEAVEEAHSKVRRYKHSAGIIMIDVDHFKRINDRHGHDVGDHVLRAISEVFASRVRTCDSVGRYGGEEFLVLLPETGLEGTLTLAERLREAIEQLEIPLPGIEPLRLTASFGVSTLHPEDPSHETVLKRADRALYRSKHEGRNRVSVDALAAP